jgi:ribonuclease D
VSQNGSDSIRVVAEALSLGELARDLAREARVALDLEYNGMHAYRARVCTVQLATTSGASSFGGNATGESDRAAVVDALAVDIAPLSLLLGDGGPIKIVHDVGFDARMLAEAGIAIGNVHDTAIAARMLGRQATGLATLLASDCGITISKEMQQHDWGKRPLDARALSYLGTDVAHLSKLHDGLWTAVIAAGIEPEVLEETRHRIASAIESARAGDPRPPYVRLKGVERVHGAELAITRGLAAAREREAERVDVPPYKIISAEAIFAIARARPATSALLRRMRGVPSAMRESFAEELLRAVKTGLEVGSIPDEERVWFDRPRVPAEEAKARRVRESRLSAWRKKEAAARSVDEQVVLPGHCMKEIAQRGAASPKDLESVAGLGAFRIARDGGAIVDALHTEPPIEDATTAASKDAKEDATTDTEPGGEALP